MIDWGLFLGAGCMGRNGRGGVGHDDRLFFGLLILGMFGVQPKVVHKDAHGHKQGEDGETPNVVLPLAFHLFLYLFLVQFHKSV